MCSIKMNANITLLQEEIVKSVSLREDNLILLALAGLKQVRDQLNPTFRIENDDFLKNVSNLSHGDNINYGKYQQHQITQTSIDSSFSTPDSLNSTGYQDQEKQSLKTRLGSLLKKNVSTPRDIKSEISSKARQRSHSLRDYHILDKFESSLNSIKNNFENFTNTNNTSCLNQDTNDNNENMIDEDKIELNVKNMKLCLNKEEVQIENS